MTVKFACLGWLFWKVGPWKKLVRTITGPAVSGEVAATATGVVVIDGIEVAATGVIAVVTKTGAGGNL